jgi:hypothetical protein
MSHNAGKTVRAILAGKKASIRDAPLEAGSPAWDDILDLTWEDVVERARRREKGFRTIRKLLSDNRFNK